MGLGLWFDRPGAPNLGFVKVETVSDPCITCAHGLFMGCTLVSNASGCRYSSHDEMFQQRICRFSTLAF